MIGILDFMNIYKKINSYRYSIELFMELKTNVWIFDHPRPMKVPLSLPFIEIRNFRATVQFVHLGDIPLIT